MGARKQKSKMVNIKMLHKAYEDMGGFFYREDINVSDSVFAKAITSLIEDGKVEFRTDDAGRICYRLTPLGIVSGELEFRKPRVIN